MRLNTKSTSVESLKRKHAGTQRQRRVTAALAVVMGLALAACGGPDIKPGTVGYVTGFAGLVAGDEPRAVMTGRDVLRAGGGAADAAVAMAFAMSVTLPSSAGLGGGGVCLVFDETRGEVQALDFTAPALNGPGGASAALPSLARGMFLLHARHGLLRWEQTLSPAETMARFGISTSRAFARELALTPEIMGDREALRVFSREGRTLREGETLTQFDLASTIGRLRIQGVGSFYGGLIARDLQRAYAEAGITLSVETLRAYAPQWRETVRVEVGHDVAHFAPGTGGEDAARLLRQALAGGGASPEAGSAGAPASAGFVAVDRFGKAVACGLSLNAPFGAKVMAPGTGMVMAAPPQAGGMRTATPLLVVNPHTSQFRFGVSGSGDTSAPAAVAALTARVLGRGEEMSQAMEPTPGHGRVQAIRCPADTRPNARTCGVAADPGWFGFAAVAGGS